jgi:Alpha-L-arabinofuranosidase B (ABFB) domain
MKFNWLNKILRISTLSLSVCGIVLTSSLSVYAQYNLHGQVVSFRSYNFPDRYIRHRNLLGYIEPINNELGRKDATFKIVRGLANSKCSSFESVNFPGHFLRHENFRLQLSRIINQQLFREDATFCIKAQLFGDASSWSFESLNFPGYYIRHKNFELWVERPDGSDLFRQDASFYMFDSPYR